MDELTYQDPCKTGDEKGCILETAIKKELSVYRIQGARAAWNAGFAECNAHADDSSIGYDKAQCKFDVCMNLPGDVAEDEQTCKLQIMPACPEGNIVGNVPCFCGWHTFSTNWKTSYVDKYRGGKLDLYCCHDEEQDTACDPTL